VETALEYAAVRDIVVETFRAELTERVYAIKRLILVARLKAVLVATVHPRCLAIEAARDIFDVVARAYSTVLDTVGFSDK